MAQALVLLMLAALLAGCARPQTFELEPYRAAIGRELRR